MKHAHDHFIDRFQFGLAVGIASTILYVIHGIFMLVMPALAYKLKMYVMHATSQEMLMQFFHVTPKGLAIGGAIVFVKMFVLGFLIAVVYDTMCTENHSKK